MDIVPMLSGAAENPAHQGETVKHETIMHITAAFYFLAIIIAGFILGSLCSGCMAWPISGLERQDMKIIHSWRESQKPDTTWTHE